MYYEIMALLGQHPDIKPVHDETAAVKYVVFNGNQWVSYDDADTFKAKIDWANNQGLGGALIWASDTGKTLFATLMFALLIYSPDDDKYSAHSGLLGKSFAHVDLSKQAFQADSITIAQNLVGQLGQDCQIVTDCTDQDNPVASRCPSGQRKVGWERGKCGVSIVFHGNLRPGHRTDCFTAHRASMLIQFVAQRRRPRLVVSGEDREVTATVNVTMVRPPSSAPHGAGTRRNRIRTNVAADTRFSVAMQETGKM